MRKGYQQLGGDSGDEKERREQALARVQSTLLDDVLESSPEKDSPSHGGNNNNNNNNEDVSNDVNQQAPAYPRKSREKEAGDDIAVPMPLEQAQTLDELRRNIDKTFRHIAFGPDRPVWFNVTKVLLYIVAIAVLARLFLNTVDFGVQESFPAWFYYFCAFLTVLANYAIIAPSMANSFQAIVDDISVEQTEDNQDVVMTGRIRATGTLVLSAGASVASCVMVHDALRNHPALQTFTVPLLIAQGLADTGTAYRVFNWLWSLFPSAEKNTHKKVLKGWVDALNHRYIDIQRAELENPDDARGMDEIQLAYLYQGKLYKDTRGKTVAKIFAGFINILPYAAVSAIAAFQAYKCSADSSDWVEFLCFTSRGLFGFLGMAAKIGLLSKGNLGLVDKMWAAIWPRTQVLPDIARGSPAEQRARKWGFLFAVFVGLLTMWAATKLVANFIWKGTIDGPALLLVASWPLAFLAAGGINISDTYNLLFRLIPTLIRWIRFKLANTTEQQEHALSFHPLQYIESLLEMPRSQAILLFEDPKGPYLDSETKPETTTSQQQLAIPNSRTLRLFDRQYHSDPIFERDEYTMMEEGKGGGVRKGLLKEGDDDEQW